MLIANPIYDSVFKYLLEDNALAKLLLSIIIGEEIVELDFLPQEYIASGISPRSLTVYRFDFAAMVKNSKGEFRQVLIEIQKAKLDTDIMRFRRYLGSQYSDPKNVKIEPVYNKKGKKVRTRKKAIPLLTIYFLWYSLEYTKAPIIRVQRECQDLTTGEKIAKKEPFIESLTHDSYVIQIPHLRHNRRTEIEKMLQVFDQERIYVDQNGNMDRHQLEINEKAIPECYRPILRRLQRAIANKELLKSMDIEDEILEELQNREREAEYERTEKEKAEKRAEIAEELAMKAEELAAKERIKNERLLALLKQFGIEPFK